MSGPDAMRAASISCIVLLTLPCLLLAAPTNLEETTALAEQDYNYDAESTGCYYNYEHYEEGDRIVTNEPCLNCTCKNRMLMCYLRVCPFTRAIGQDCTVTKSPDQCCPVISCPEVPVQLITSSTTTELPASTTAVGYVDDYGCTMEDNKFYADGAKVPSNPDKPCELCYCIRNKTACVMLECTLHIEGCQPVYEEGVCCPVRYDCDQPAQLDGPSSTYTTTGLVFTTTPSGSLDCVHNAAVYHDGESIPTEKPCEHCYCVRGDIVCAVQDCGQPLKGKHCKPNPTPEGQCCPTTYECSNSTIPLEKLPEVESTTSLAYETNDLTPPEGTQIDDQPNTENSLDEEIHHNPEDLIVEHDGLPTHDDTSPPEFEVTHDETESHPEENQPEIVDFSTSVPVHDSEPQSLVTEHAQTTEPTSSIVDPNVNKDEAAATQDAEQTLNNADASPSPSSDVVNSDEGAAPAAEGVTTVATVNQEVSTEVLNDKLPSSDSGDTSPTTEQAEDINSVTTAAGLSDSSVSTDQQETLPGQEQVEYMTPVADIGSSPEEEQTTGAVNADQTSTEPSVNSVSGDSVPTGGQEEVSSNDIAATETPITSANEKNPAGVSQDEPVPSGTEPTIANNDVVSSTTLNQDDTSSSADITATEPAFTSVNEENSPNLNQDEGSSTVTEAIIVNEESPATSSQDDSVSSTDVTATETAITSVNEESSPVSQDEASSSGTEPTVIEGSSPVSQDSNLPSGTEPTVIEGSSPISQDSDLPSGTEPTVIEGSSPISQDSDSPSGTEPTVIEGSVPMSQYSDLPSGTEPTVIEVSSPVSQDSDLPSGTEPTVIEGSSPISQDSALPSGTEPTVIEGSSPISQDSDLPSGTEPTVMEGSSPISQDTDLPSGTEPTVSDGSTSISQDGGVSSADVTVTEPEITGLNEESSPSVSQDEVSSSGTEPTVVGGSSPISQDDVVSSADVTVTEPTITGLNEESSPSVSQDEVSSSGTEPTVVGGSSPISQDDVVSSADVTVTEPTITGLNEESSPSVSQDEVSSSSTEPTVVGGSSPISQDDVVSSADVTVTEPTITGLNEESSPSVSQDEAILSGTEPTITDEETPASSQDGSISSAEPSATEASFTNVDSSGSSTLDQVTSIADVTSTESAAPGSVHEETSPIVNGIDAASSDDQSASEPSVTEDTQGTLSTSGQDEAILGAQPSSTEQPGHDDVSSTAGQDDKPSADVSATESTITNDISESSQDSVSIGEVIESSTQSASENNYSSEPATSVENESTTLTTMNTNDASNVSPNVESTPEHSEATTADKETGFSPSEESATGNTNLNIESSTASDEINSSSVDNDSSAVNNVQTETSTSENIPPSVDFDEVESDTNVDQTESATAPSSHNINEVEPSSDTSEVSTDASAINADETSTTSGITSESSSKEPESFTATGVSIQNEGVSPVNQDNSAVSSNMDQNESITVSGLDAGQTASSSISQNTKPEDQAQDSTEVAVTGENPSSESPVSQDVVASESTGDIESSTSATVDENLESVNQVQTEGSTASVPHNDLNTQEVLGAATALPDVTISTEQPAVDYSTADVNENPTQAAVSQDVSPTESTGLSSTVQESDEKPPGVADDTSASNISENEVTSGNTPNEVNSNDDVSVSTVGAPAESDSVPSNPLVDKIIEPSEVSSTATPVEELASSSASDQVQDTKDQTLTTSNEISSDANSATTPEHTQSQTNAQAENETPVHDELPELESDPSEDLSITSDEHDVSQTLDGTDDTDVTPEENNTSPANGDCIIDDQVHANNSRIETKNPCHVQCLCMNGAPSCESLECPPPPPTHKNCMPIHPGPDLCCPAYACDGPLTPALQSDSQVSSDYKPIDATTFGFTATEVSVTPEKHTEVTSDTENEVTSNENNADATQPEISSSTVEPSSANGPLSTESEASSPIETEKDQTNDLISAIESESTTPAAVQQSSTNADQAIPVHDEEQSAGTEASPVTPGQDSSINELSSDHTNGALASDVTPTSEVTTNDPITGDQAQGSPSTSAVSEVTPENDPTVTEQTGVENILSSTQASEQDQIANEIQKPSIPSNDVPNTSEGESVLPVTEGNKENVEQQSPVQSEDQEVGSSTPNASGNEEQSVPENGVVTMPSTSVNEESSSVSPQSASTDGLQSEVSSNDVQSTDAGLTTPTENQELPSQNQDETINKDAVQQAGQEQTTASNFEQNQDSVTTVAQLLINADENNEKDTSAPVVSEATTQLNVNDPNFADQAATGDSTVIPIVVQESSTELTASDVNQQGQMDNVNQEGELSTATTGDQPIIADNSEHENDIPSANEQPTIAQSDVTIDNSSNQAETTAVSIESEPISNNDNTESSQSEAITEASLPSSSQYSGNADESQPTTSDILTNDGQTHAYDSTTPLPVELDSNGDQNISPSQSESIEPTTASVSGSSDEISNEATGSSTDTPAAGDAVSSIAEETTASAVPSSPENDSEHITNEGSTLLPVETIDPEQTTGQNDAESFTSSSIQAEPNQDAQEQATSTPNAENMVPIQSVTANDAQQPNESNTQDVPSSENVPTESENGFPLSDNESTTLAVQQSDIVATEEEPLSPSQVQQNTEVESSTGAITSDTVSEDNSNPSQSPDVLVQETSSSPSDQTAENETSAISTESIPEGDQAIVDQSVTPEETSATVNKDSEPVNDTEPGNNQSSSTVESEQPISQDASPVDNSETSTAVSSPAEPQVEGEQQNVDQEQPAEGSDQQSNQGAEQGSESSTSVPIESSSTENKQPTNQDAQPLVETETSAPATSQSDSLVDHQQNGDQSAATVDVEKPFNQNTDQAGETESTTALSSQSDSNVGEQSSTDQMQPIEENLASQNVGQVGETESTTSLPNPSVLGNAQSEDVVEVESTTVGIQSEPQGEGEQANLDQTPSTENINQEPVSQDGEQVSGSEPTNQQIESDSTPQTSQSEPQAEGDQIIVDGTQPVEVAETSGQSEDQPAVDQAQSTDLPVSQDSESASATEPTIGESSQSLPVSEQATSQDAEIPSETESPVLQTSQQVPAEGDQPILEQVESTEQTLSQDSEQNVSIDSSPGVTQSIPVETEQPISQDVDSTSTVGQSEELEGEQKPNVDQTQSIEGSGQPVGQDVGQTDEADSTTALPVQSEPSSEAASAESIIPEVQNENESTTVAIHSESAQNQDSPIVDATPVPSNEGQEPQNADQSVESGGSSTVQPESEGEQPAAVSQNSDETGNVETSTAGNVEQPIVQDVSEPSTQALDQNLNEEPAPADKEPPSQPSVESNDAANTLPDRVGQPETVETSSPENTVPETHSPVPDDNIQSGAPEQDTQQAQAIVPAATNYSSPFVPTSPHYSDIATTQLPVHPTLGFPMSEGIDPQLSEFLNQMSTQTPWTHKPNIEDPFPLPETDYDEEEEDSFGPGTCRYGGKVYVSAQQIPRDDPCDFCFCFRSDIICLQQSCPPPIHGCRQEAIQGFCCPRYECHVSMATGLNLTTTTTTLPPHFLPHVYNGAARHMGCFLEGRAYVVGEKVHSRSGPCLDCICGEDGKMKCDPLKCTPEPLIRKMVESTSR